jgi:hypothetical protein
MGREARPPSASVGDRSATKWTYVKLGSPALRLIAGAHSIRRTTITQLARSIWRDADDGVEREATDVGIYETAAPSGEIVIESLAECQRSSRLPN